MENYIIPASTRIGHVHLKVSDLQRSLDFYCGLLGFELITKYGDTGCFYIGRRLPPSYRPEYLAQQRSAACTGNCTRIIPYRHIIS